MEKTTWGILHSINCNEFAEKKNGLTYLSWAHAWGLVKELFADANYRVVQYNGNPFLYDENLGYLVTTEVTINGETIPMNLPVMDGANKAQKSTPYSYETKYSGQKTVEAATMFDINTAIMRCLTKNLAMFGLGHYIYAGEDLPITQKEERVTQSVDGDTQEKINNCSSIEELKTFFDSIPNPSKEIKELLTKKKIQLKNK
jgi:hypothetical protein